MGSHALAPRCFADLLDAPVPDDLRGPGVPERLLDLDNATCRALSPRLAEGLKRSVIERLQLVANLVRERPLPPLPAEVKVEDLELTTRARNGIENATWYRDVTLATMTFGHLLRTKNMGWKSALELAVVFESARAPTAAACLEDELGALLDVGTERARSIALRRLGWDGRGGETLASLANEIGVTTERVRQMVLRAAERLRVREPTTPRLDEALSLAAAEAPAPAHEIARKLAAAGVSRAPFHPHGLRTAARLLRKESPISIVRRASVPTVVPTALAAVAQGVQELAEQVVRSDGVGRVAEVVSRSRAPVEADAVRALLSSRTDCRWLGQSSEWFFVGEPNDSPLVRHAAKAFAGGARVSAKVLRSVLTRSRHLRFARAVVAPVDVLLDLYRGLDGYRVQEETIEAAEDGDLADVLTKVERVFFRTFQKHGPVLVHADLERLLRREGFRGSNFAGDLPRLPFLRKYSSGVYGLIDERVETAFRAATAAGPVEHQTTADGGFRATYEVSKAISSAGAVRLPPGEWPRRASAHDEAGVVVGTVVKESGVALGMRPWLARKRAKAGHKLVLWRDSRRAPLRVAVGGERALARAVLQEAPERSPPMPRIAYRKLSHADLLAAVQTLVADGRIAANDVATAAERARKIAALEAELARLRGSGGNSSSAPAPRPAPKAKRKITNTPKRVAAMKRQGKYMAVLAKLTGRDRARVRATAKEDGVPAAIGLGERLLGGD